MNDQYAADVGDFGKYGLLRALCRALGEGGHAARLAVLWWATRNAGGSFGDGRHVSYLQPQNAPEFEPCDPELYAGLRALVAGGTRSLAAIESSGLLGSSTLFHSEHLDGAEVQSALQRRSNRASWLERAATAARGAAVVFLDPDNGLSSTVTASSADARKYVLKEELRAVASAEQTVVVYHHAGRHKPIAEQERHWLEQVAGALPDHAPPLALRYHRGTARLYFIVPARSRHSQVSAFLQQFLSTPWRGHFSSSSLPNLAANTTPEAA